MSTAYQRRLDQLTAKYADEQTMLPKDILALLSDLHDLVSVLTGRVTQLEQRDRGDT
jgi:hypothetical protein